LAYFVYFPSSGIFLYINLEATHGLYIYYLFLLCYALRAKLSTVVID